MIDEFRHSKGGEYSYYNLMHFICFNSKYNDFAFELLETDTPLTWSLGLDLHFRKEYTMFNYTLYCGNVELAIRMIKKRGITEVLTSLPYEMLTLKNLVNSEHIVDFLKCVSDNPQRMEELVLQDTKPAAFIGMRNEHSEVESKITGIEIPKSDNESDQEDGQSENEHSHGSLYYQYELLCQVGTCQTTSYPFYSTALSCMHTIKESIFYRSLEKR